MKKALILHSWYGSAEADWYPWLKSELENKGYTVYLPDFPEFRTDVPDILRKKILENSYLRC